MKTLRQLLFISLISLTLIESFLRLFFPLRTSDSIDFYHYDSTLGYRLKPGYQTNLTDYKQEYLVSSSGSVGGVSNYSPYDKMVFALGDSFTQGTGNPVASSYPAFVDLIHNTASGNYSPNLAVVNLGLAAYGGTQNLLSYDVFSKKLGNPDYVFYLGTDNDKLDDLRFDAGYRHLQLVDGNPNIPLLGVLQFLSKFEFVKRLKQVRQEFIGSKLLSSLPASETQECLSTAYYQRHNLEKLLELSERDNFKLVISWVLSPMDEEPGSCSSYIWAKKWAVENDVAFADYASSLFSTKRHWDIMPVLHDHSAGHYRSWVYFLIARTYLSHVE